MLFYSKMTVLETLDSERRGKWRQDVTEQVFFCLQMPGGSEHYLLPNARVPALIVDQMPGVYPGECSWLELTRT